MSKSEREIVWAGKDNLKIVNSKLEHEDGMAFSFDIKVLKKELTKDEIDNYLFFVEQIGIKHLLLNLAEKSLVDYVIGVLVGLELIFRYQCSPKIALNC